MAKSMVSSHGIAKTFSVVDVLTPARLYSALLVGFCRCSGSWSHEGNWKSSAVVVVVVAPGLLRAAVPSYMGCCWWSRGEVNGEIWVVASSIQYRRLGDPGLVMEKPSSPCSPKQGPLVPLEGHASSEMGAYTPMSASSLDAAVVVAGAKEAGDVGDLLSPGTLYGV